MSIELVVGENTYATLAELKLFLSQRPYNQFFTGVSDDDLSRYLILAYDVLDRFKFDVDNSPTTTSGETTTATEWIKQAQNYEALHLFFIWSNSDVLARQSLQLQGVSRIVIDKLTEEYRSSPRRVGGLASKEAFEIIQPYLVYCTKVYHDI